MPLPFLAMQEVPLNEWKYLGVVGEEEEDALGLGLPVGLRQRKKTASTGVCAPEPTEPIPDWVNRAHIVLSPAAFLLLAIGCTLVAGMWSIIYTPLATTAVGEFVIPENSHCLRVTRAADYVTATITVGKPAAMLEVLVRLDKVESNMKLRLFSTRIAESQTVSCTDGEEAVCQDVAVVHLHGPNSHGERAIVSFNYTNPTQEAISYGTATGLGLDGEFYLAREHDYYLTATHLCYTPLSGFPMSDASIAAFEDGQGFLKTSSVLYNHPVLKSSPVAVAQKEHCGTMEDVALFPLEAADESAWLGLGSQRLYEYAGTGIADRREVVEVGSTCAASAAAYERAYSLFRLDCQAYNVECETNPTIPFRRVAQSQLRLAVHETGSVQIWTFDDVRLHNLPKFSETEASVWMAALKLAVMILTAGIVWIRSAKKSSSMAWLYVHSTRAAFGIAKVPEDEDWWSQLEDAFIGLCAIGARHGIAQWRLQGLEADDQARVCYAEIIASILSLLHWFVRYVVIEANNELPLTKIGGSTAIVDASCAVMLAFGEPPMLVTSTGRFDPTARLLTALLLSLTTVQRCIFASASCAVRWAASKDNPNCSPAYVLLAFLSAIMWLCQSVSVGIMLADIFVVPSAFSMSRALVGDMQPVSIAIFFSVLVAGMPQLLRTSKKILDRSVG